MKELAVACFTCAHCPVAVLASELHSRACLLRTTQGGGMSVGGTGLQISIVKDDLTFSSVRGCESFQAVRSRGFASSCIWPGPTESWAWVCVGATPDFDMKHRSYFTLGPLAWTMSASEKIQPLCKGAYNSLQNEGFSFSKPSKSTSRLVFPGFLESLMELSTRLAEDSSFSGSRGRGCYWDHHTRDPEFTASLV